MKGLYGFPHTSSIKYMSLARIYGHAEEDRATARALLKNSGLSQVTAYLANLVSPISSMVSQ